MAILGVLVLALAGTKTASHQVARGEELVCDQDDEGTCAPSMLELKQASVTRRVFAHGADDDGGEPGAGPAAGAASRGAGWGNYTLYCHESEDRDGCWAKKPTTALECTPFSGNFTCKCAGDNGCHVGLTAENVTGSCAEVQLYIGGKSKVETNGSHVGVSGISKELFCTRMVAHDQWAQKGLLATTPAEKSKGGWAIFFWCPTGYTDSWYNVFSGGRCHRQTRYLGEACSRDWGPEGSCADGEGDYKTSCDGSKCVPHAVALGRDLCECSWSGKNFFAVCSAKDDACSGHACVWNMGDGNHYCDYGTPRDWQALASR